MSVISSHRLRIAVQCLRSGGVIAYPTEAVFGLGCDPWNGEAVERLLAIKQRAVSKGLILIASHQDQLKPFVESLPEDRLREIWSSWPGPNTWLFPASERTPDWLTGRFETLAVRVTAHPIAAALCRAYGGPIVSTSANRAQLRPARTAVQVRLGFENGPDYVLAGACSGANRPSRIRDGLTGQLLRV
ncbi:ribosome maturation factor rimN [Thiorhodococcus drewsii AZ1]|uniref:Threonylcarbamoyl-AMP synthase n=1 Tax=Thiorhodococcus drewsii AZ1 TaxID=765913 RepID=G2DWH8_9GAMM|nr:Sua5/YciO/YrdC/YwlC family protein [Thiorhodococcus drewsii]EGV33678.1 ribosome maturation factor rimN [Thiorhodococcus drewsii AZ1]